MLGCGAAYLALVVTIVGEFVVFIFFGKTRWYPSCLSVYWTDFPLLLVVLDS